MALANTTWTEERSIPTFAPLRNEIETEVVIIGGGIAGIMSAYLLAKAGKRVVVLEADRLASGATLRTTAFITHVIDTDPSDLIKMFGAKKAKLIWSSHAEAIDLIEQIVESEEIDCDFKRCSNYVYAKDDAEFKDLKDELEAIKKLGFTGTLKQKPNLHIRSTGYIELKNQAKFNPTKFLSGLVTKAKLLGVQFFEKTEATAITDGKSPTVTAEKGSVQASWVITATYDPLHNPKETFGKKGMYKSYVFEVRVPKGKFPEGIYEDMENPYHYFRIDPGQRYDRMIFGGEDHRKELPVSERKSFTALRKHLQQLLQEVPYTIIKKWTGPILEPSDGLALIGEFKPGQLIASAFSGNGMTYSAIVAKLFVDSITHKKNPYKSIYDPTRTPTAKQLLVKVRDYAGELYGGAIKNSLQ